MKYEWESDKPNPHPQMTVMNQVTGRPELASQFFAGVRLEPKITEQQLKCLRGEHEGDGMELRVVQLHKNERYGDMYGVKVDLCRHCRCLFVEVT